jgi:hypothetical protein
VPSRLLRSAALIAVLWAGTTSLRRPASAAPVPCVPAIELSAEAPIQQEIAQALERRGLSLGGAQSCGVVRASVLGHGALLLVEIEDPNGRTSARTVTSAETVASLIESWVRTDLTAPAVVPLPKIERAESALAPEPARVEAPAPPAEPRPAYTWAIGAAGIGAISNNGNFWSGIAVQGCATLGEVCVGGGARYLVEQESSSDNQESHRRVWEALASVEMPFTTGDFVVRPGIGFGLAQTHTSYEPPGPDTPGKPETRAAYDALGLRIAPQIAVSAHLHSSLTLDVALAFEVAPFANANDPPADPTLAKPPEPWCWAGATLGLRWEAP